MSYVNLKYGNKKQLNFLCAYANVPLFITLILVYIKQKDNTQNYQFIKISDTRGMLKSPCVKYNLVSFFGARLLVDLGMYMSKTRKYLLNISVFNCF